MAKSAFEIQMNYNNAIRQAASLEQIAKQLKNLANKDMQDCVSEISHNWTGSNSNAYARKCNLLKEKIIKTAEKLEKTAETIRRIAKNTYDAEMRALRLALIRKY
jgi:uncharacterized protein YukE